MEIEFDINRWKKNVTENFGGLFLVLLVFFVVLGFLGKSFTPATNTILSWSEWQIVKVEKEYNKQLSTDQQYAESLSKLLNAAPDPVRAQIVTDQVVQGTSTGLDALERQRQGLQAAATAVRQWAIGAGTMDEAQAALNNAIQLLKAAEISHQQQENQEQGVNEWR